MADELFQLPNGGYVTFEKISRTLESIISKHPESYYQDDSTGYVRMCEHNYDIAEETLRQQAENVKDCRPVKRGKWSEYSRNALETYIECTNCCVASRPIHLQMVTRDGSGLPDYCPNCGAKMRGDADETT